MPDDDWALSQGTVEFRQEERLWALGRFECDRDDIDESAGVRDEHTDEEWEDLMNRADEE